MTTVKKNDKTGKWEFCISAGKDPITGKRKQIRRRGFASRDEAMKAFLEVKREVLDNEFVDISKLTYAQYMGEYWRERKIKLQTSTYETHLIIYENNILPKLGHIKLQEIKYSHIQNLVNDSHEQGHSAHTTHLIFRIIYGSLKKAQLRSLIKNNPAQEVTLPKRRKREMTVWTLKQVNYFLKNAPHVCRVTRCLIGIQLGLLAGLRQGEILGLRWRDIDFENKIIYIRQTVSQSGEIKQGAKNNSSVRSIAISNKLLNMLLLHREQIEWEKERCTGIYRDNDLVLPTRYGSPMIPRNFRKEFYVLTEKLGLPRIRFHDTRATHVTLLVEQNVNIKLISERLGHSNIETTFNIYSHVLPNMQRSVSDKLDEIID
ncbi:tyrosine-type recombinase/integrase [Niallia sp. 01092]|uniref:tyrosine-type recombinase/integrase n=1 Tax=Niallia sp. 01092 TaxID=3457759 RepID=UPI003FD363E6